MISMLIVIWLQLSTMSVVVELEVNLQRTCLIKARKTGISGIKVKGFLLTFQFHLNLHYGLMRLDLSLPTTALIETQTLLKFKSNNSLENGKRSKN